ncbi:MAG: pyruvate dehydrogenase complex dihydrolipoamide acetyltransferase [Sphingomonadales bacterium]|nr:pyruvate dehydrogenase complex dihydrolipoamide acetyltransferase [Sphingomonadales bacterium]
MAIELTMPALSPTMEKGTLAKWLVAEGDTIKAGDMIAEIETDKATMEYEAAEDGRIARLVIAEGTDDVLVGAVIALLAEAGEAAPEPSVDVAAPAAQAIVAPSAVAAPPAQAPAPPPAAPAPQPAPRRLSPADRIKVSPLAARIAEARGIELAGVTGSGPNGRIVRADLGISSLLAATETLAASTPAAVPVIAPPPAGVPVETVKLSSMRKTIARRLTESKTSVPHFYLTARCNLGAMLEVRQQLNAALAETGTKLSVNDLLIKALAYALAEVPDANVQFGGDALHRFGRVDVSMAVAIDGGLVTPVLRDVASLSLSAIASQSKALAAKARDGKLTPEDYAGGTVSISNLGMFGIDEMVPVINPPQALILGVGAGVEQPWAVDGQIALATIMAATASFDHRAIDGATGARFMQAFRQLVEEPMRLLA